MKYKATVQDSELTFCSQIALYPAMLLGAIKSNFTAWPDKAGMFRAHFYVP
jgi:hypothetical protein